MHTHRIIVVLAATGLIAGCMGPVHMMGRRGMEGRTHEEAMLDSAIRVTRSSLIPRADTLVRRTELLSAPLHATAVGVFALLRELDAMHQPGVPVEMRGVVARDMTEMHRAAEQLVGDLERTARAMDHLRQDHSDGRP